MFTAGLAIVLVASPLLALALWLGYCFVISRTHPKEAAKIIEATGRWYPRSPWRPPKAKE